MKEVSLINSLSLVANILCKRSWMLAKTEKPTVSDENKVSHTKNPSNKIKPKRKQLQLTVTLGKLAKRKLTKKTNLKKKFAEKRLR